FIEDCIAINSIDCEFNRVPWHLFTTSESSAHDPEVEAEFEKARQLELSVLNSVPPLFPFRDVSKITTLNHQAQFNPFKYVSGLAKAANTAHCQVFENTKVTNVKDGTPCQVFTENGVVTAKKVIMATHSPKGIYEVHTEMEVNREFALAAKITGELPPEGICWNITGSNQYSVRPYSNEEGDYLIVLGEPYLTGTKEENEDCIVKIKEYLNKHFTIESIVYEWAAQNYKPADGLPYIGTSPLQTNTYI